MFPIARHSDERAAVEGLKAPSCCDAVPLTHRSPVPRLSCSNNAAWRMRHSKQSAEAGT